MATEGLGETQERRGGRHMEGGRGREGASEWLQQLRVRRVPAERGKEVGRREEGRGREGGKGRSRRGGQCVEGGQEAGRQGEER